MQILLREIQSLETEVASELQRLQKHFNFSIKEGKAHFTKEALTAHKALRISVAKFIFGSNFLFILTAPIIYSLVIPAFILDLFCSTYQAICFPLYKIKKVNRKDYIRLDRHRLAYLNGVEKLNCDYCGYFNGVIAYVREIGARTEQYWCPIRHALAVKGLHSSHSLFVDYGDGSEYQARLRLLRKKLEEEKQQQRTI